jgi:hypothetical protein
VTKIRSPDFGIDRHENPADSAGKGIRGRRIRKFIPTTANKHGGLVGYPRKRLCLDVLLILMS